MFKLIGTTKYNLNHVSKVYKKDVTVDAVTKYYIAYVALSGSEILEEYKDKSSRDTAFDAIA